MTDTENKEYIELDNEVEPLLTKEDKTEEVAREEPTAHLEVDNPDRVKPEGHKEMKRLKRNAYYRDYYHKNKHKYKYTHHKNGEPKKKRGERGSNLNYKYRLSVLDEESGKKLVSQKFKTLYEISDAIDIPQYTVRLIARGKYKGEGAKVKKTKKYKKFLIEKLKL